MSRSRVSPVRPSRFPRLATAAGISLALTIGVVSASPPASAAPPEIPKPYLGKIVKTEEWKPGAVPDQSSASVVPPRTALEGSRTEVTLSQPARSGTGPRTEVTEPGSTPPAVVAGEWQALGESGLAVVPASPIDATASSGPDDAAVAVEVLSADVIRKYAGQGMVCRLSGSDMVSDE